MFLKNGKSIFGNVGLLVSFAIIIILLYFSYTKCMATQTNEQFKNNKDKQDNLSNNNNQATIAREGFINDGNLLLPPPKNVRINIEGATVRVNFTVDTEQGKPLPNKFIVVLAQYDYNMKPTGNNKFFMSSEFNINSAVQYDKSMINTNLCEYVNGIPTCQYVFNDLDNVDINGSPYYYKLGIASIYNNGNSSFETPYNVSNSNKLFTLSSSIETQNSELTDFIKYKQMQQTKNASPNNLSGILSTPDGKYEFIKSQLGGYPNALIMDPISSQQNLLSDLVDKSMSEAILNVNVGVSSPNDIEQPSMSAGVSSPTNIEQPSITKL